MAKRLTFDEFKLCKVDDLRQFIKQSRYLATYKVKEELVALTFALREQNVPVVPSKDEVR